MTGQQGQWTHLKAPETRNLSSTKDIDPEENVISAVGKVSINQPRSPFEMKDRPVVVGENAIGMIEESSENGQDWLNHWLNNQKKFLLVQVVEFILPRKFSIVGDAVVPNHTTLSNLTSHLMRQEAHKMFQQRNLCDVDGHFNVQ